MSNVGREMAGAWRSLRYDLTRRPERAEVDGPTDVIYPEYEQSERPRRRLLAATTFGVLALAGAAGTYFAVVNGLGALVSDESPPPDPLPAVAEPGRPAPQGPAAAPSASTPANAPDAATKPTKGATTGKAPVRPPAPSPTCACVTPPVPRPTSPPPVGQSPDPAPSATPSESPSTTPQPTDETSAPPTGG